MSNYDYRPLPEELAEYGDRIHVGAEVINGTDDVKLVLHDSDPEDADTETVMLHLTSRQARAFARTVWDAAAQADWAKFTANRPDPKTGPSRGDRIVFADELESRGSAVCDCSPDVNPPMRDGRRLAHHCDCRAVVVSAIVRRGGSLTRHAQECCRTTEDFINAERARRTP